jgi:hypothetical protein
LNGVRVARTPPNPPSRPSVCAMARRRSCTGETLPNRYLIDPNRTLVPFSGAGQLGSRRITRRDRGCPADGGDELSRVYDSINPKCYSSIEMLPGDLIVIVNLLQIVGSCTRFDKIDRGSSRRPNYSTRMRIILNGRRAQPYPGDGRVSSVSVARASNDQAGVSMWLTTEA